jgi:hypothetical protein
MVSEIQQVKIFSNLCKCHNLVSSFTSIQQITPYKFAAFPFEASQVLQIPLQRPTASFIDYVENC